MAREVIEKLIDDLDGGEAAETVTFGLDGATYEIDLSKKSAAAFRKSLARSSQRGAAALRLAPLAARRRRRRTAPSRSAPSTSCNCVSGQPLTRSPCPLGGVSRTRSSSSTDSPAAAEHQRASCAAVRLPAVASPLGSATNGCTSPLIARVRIRTFTGRLARRGSGSSVPSTRAATPSASPWTLRPVRHGACGRRSSRQRPPQPRPH